MVVNHEALEACVAGVLMVRGFPAEEAMEMASKIDKPHPDKALVDIVREVSSVMLTLNARGLLRDAAPRCSTLRPPMLQERPEKVDEVDQRYIRELAVTLVDGACGYTMEFAGSPTQHRDFYDELERGLMDAFSAFRKRTGL